MMFSDIRAPLPKAPFLAPLEMIEMVGMDICAESIE
jgi:hypothetical protein